MNADDFLKYESSACLKVITQTFDFSNKPDNAELGRFVRLCFEIGDACQSPLEEVVAPIMALLSYKPRLAICGVLSKVNIDVTPQGKVGSYRADYLITLKFDERIKQVAVELDGHGFHERTVDMVIRDRRRDQEFQSLGLMVLRFTYAELYQFGFSRVFLNLVKGLSAASFQMGWRKQNADGDWP